MWKKTIKKALPMLAGALIISMVVSIVPSGFFAAADKGVKSETKSTTYVTLEQAEQIALDKVDDKSAEITYYEVELTYKDPHYDFEVTTNNRKYEIEIHGITGEILEYEVEKINGDKIKKTKIKDDKVKSNNGRFISKDEAKMAALEHINNKTAHLAGFEIQLEKDIPHFLVAVKTSTHKYIMKIEAETAKVYDVIKSREANDDDDDKNDYKIRGNSDKINKDNKGKSQKKENNTPVVKVKYITKEEAIEIALAKIGRKAILEEIEFEKDDNPPIYEIEMYDKDYEYEIEIHAISGAILKYERDED